MTATKSQPQGGMSFSSRETVFLSLGGLTDEMAGGMAYETLEVSTATAEVSSPASAPASFISDFGSTHFTEGMT